MIRYQFAPEAYVRVLAGAFFTGKGFVIERGTTHALLVFDGDELVGAATYWTRRKAHTHLHAVWVDKRYRDQGIAQTLWHRVIAHTRPKTVSVNPITRGGRKLVAATQRAYPELRWEVE